jgi:3-oxoadipate CoA-transferase beta subunit
MELAIGAKQTYVTMEHLTKANESKLVLECSYPLTSIRCVRRVYTDLAVIDLTARGAVVRDMVAGLNFESLQRLADRHTPGWHGAVSAGSLLDGCHDTSRSPL